MYPPKFAYYRAGSVSEALSLLAQHSGAKMLAGGHSLLPVMKLRLADPGVLIDIGRINELSGITQENGSFRIGSLTTHATVAAHEDLPRVLTEAASMIGDPQVRNRGTVGGNVAHADPASDLPTVFTALGATFHMVGAGGERAVAASDFFTGLFETALGEGEILTAVTVPAEGTRTGSAYVKLFNPASRYAMVGVAASLTLDMTGKCSAASIALGGLTPQATAASSVAAALVGERLSEEVIHSAAAAVVNDLGDDILGDIHASADYRREMAPVMVARAVEQAAKRAGWLSKVGEWVSDLVS